MRVHSGVAKGEIEWRRPTRETLQIMLHNPLNARYYAYGRRQVEPRRKTPGRPSTGRVVKSSDEWLVLLPAYIPPADTTMWWSSRAFKIMPGHPGITLLRAFRPAL